MKKRIILLLLLVQVLSTYAQKLTVSSLTTDYNKNPIGWGNRTPAFSWKLISTERNTMQTAFELQVANTIADIREGKNLSWTTGRVTSDQSIHILYKGPALQSRQRFHWRVRVWDNHGNTSPWSEVQYWETGLLNHSDWSARWIETEDITQGEVGPAPVFFKAFNVDSSVKSARLYITARGLYEAKLNGQLISDHVLSPGWTSYHKRLQYQTYDVTALLKAGENTATVTIGDGWYRGFLDRFDTRNLYGKEVGLLYQLELTLNDGSKQVIASDNSWRSSFDGPVKGSDIYHGEIFDTRLDKPVTTGIAKNWKEVRVVDLPLDNLVAQEAPAVVRQERFKAQKLIKTPKGETVIDFGQNLTGWVQVKIKGSSGDTLKIRHAEVLDKEGNFYTDNLRAARQEDQYVLNGREQILEPRFTFHGFRYIKIDGLQNEPNIDDYTAVAVYSAMPPAGTFTSSNSLVNQLQSNIQWGQKSNFVDVPTDCPQRDERLGWLGDAQVFFNTAAYNMNVATFFSKWLKDVNAEQYESGSAPVMVPSTVQRDYDGSAGWGDAITIIPWNFYTVYGDKQLLERQYDSMKAWVEYIRGVSKDNLWNSGPHYGDWLFYTMDNDREGLAAITDRYLIAQTFYAASTQNLINAAKVLGKNDEVKTYTALLKDIKEAFNCEYVTPSGQLVSNSQTAYVLALNFDMLPEDKRQQAAQRLVENIRSYNDHLTTGFLGTPYLCHVLSRYGYTDVAYQLLLQDTYPSWLYPVKMGATTIWERWNGIKPDGTFETVTMNSFNHYAYGAIGDWMYKVVAGINTIEPAYKTMLIAPKLGGGFTSAEAKLETMYGEVSSAWKVADGKVSLNITVPANTVAQIVLPGAANAQVIESSVEISKIESIQNIRKREHDLVFDIGSGSFHFEYPMLTRCMAK